MLITVNSTQDNRHALITDEINDLIHREINFPEHTRFAYSVINKRHLEPPVIYSNYPTEWINKYINMTLYEYDPVIIIALQRITPFTWSDKIPPANNTCYKDIFKFAKKYNISNGHAFPLHDHDNNLATLSLYTEGDTELFQHYIANHKKNIQQLLLSIHERYIIEKRHDQNSLRDKLDKKLTSREIEALRWASIGKTYNEIAIIMGITESTVKFHIGNIIIKLGVVNAKHAIKKASDLHLLQIYE
ncbi:LuxR family transcriptional regulator [Acerihabitans sp. KWT182]|uniref:LuxR family transcriptional regulator n=1 Tax=Acerihabitans sp. KWT182 TaxID=3157919 RepID=A0AAU7QA63_9GAMM